MRRLYARDRNERAATDAQEGRAAPVDRAGEAREDQKRRRRDY